MSAGDITALGTALDIDERGVEMSVVRLSDDVFYMAYSSAYDGNGYNRVFQLGGGTSTDDIVAIGAENNFDTLRVRYTESVLVGTDKVLSVWQNADALYAQVFDIDGSHDITGEDSIKDFSAYAAWDMSIIPMGSNKYLLVYPGNTEGKAQLIEVDTGDWSIDTIGSEQTFDSSGRPSRYLSASSISATHVIINWRTSTNLGKSECFSVNLTTGALASAGTSANFYTTSSSFYFMESVPLNSNTIAICYYSTLDVRGVVRTVKVDGSYNISFGDKYYYTVGSVGGYNPIMLEYDTDKLLIIYRDSSSGGRAQTFSVDGDAITPLGGVTIFASAFNYAGAAEISTDTIAIGYKGSGTGYTRAIEIENTAPTSETLLQII